MRSIYTIAIACYGFCLRMAALFGHRKAKQIARGWREWPRRVEMLGKGAVWFHAASLGEFEQARPVMEAYRRQHPDQPMLLTFFSPSGYEVRKDYGGADAVCYLPLDTPRNVRRFLDAVHPKMAFFVKYDIWYNYLNQLHRRHIPTYLFSAIFRPGQYFFKPWGRWFGGQIKSCYSRIFVQNEESLHLLQGLGISQCSIAADTRFDRVGQIAQKAASDSVVEQWLNATEDGSIVLVAGSSWPPDESLLARLMVEDERPMRLIVAPHEVNSEHVEQIERLFPSSLRYSQIASGDVQPDASQRTLIIDNVGKLSQLYRYGAIAYIGGGFGVGIHNILEAITFGLPVVFGPNYAKFQEAHDIIALGGGWSISTYEELTGVVVPLLADPARLNTPSEICREYISSHVGGTDAILRSLEA
ncbi:MAG: 3-deoxy-D-manno-octulosonic acid transferase [Bacteroidales bacterium]|nr:3-deoxy-D-manno-octulosonic acid transferase [Bacteroidales bacterium]